MNNSAKYFYDESQQAINFWEAKANYFRKSFVLSVFLSASPILLVLILIFILSCMANLFQKWLIIKRNENRFKKIEKYQILLELNQQFLDKNNIINSSSIKIKEEVEEEEEEEEPIPKIESNLKRKATHAFGLSELYIPDENKVPIVLLNEAIARNPVVGLSNFVEEKKQIEFDPEIAHFINELCHPKFVLTDEDETNSIIEIIKSDDESHIKDSKEARDSTAINSEEDRKYSKSNRRKSTLRTKKLSKKNSKSSEEDEGFNIKTIGKKILFKNKESSSDMNSNSDNDYNCEIKVFNNIMDKEKVVKFPDIKIHVEDFDEINNSNQENQKSFSNDKNITGISNQTFEKENI
jgi:hypothetical protein